MMHLPLIYHCGEGEMLRNGFNYGSSFSSRFRGIIKLGRLYFYLRIRSPLVGGKRCIFEIHWNRPLKLGRMTFDPDILAVRIAGCLISYELLYELAHGGFTRSWWRFTKEGDILKVEVQDAKTR